MYNTYHNAACGDFGVRPVECESVPSGGHCDVTDGLCRICIGIAIAPPPIVN